MTLNTFHFAGHGAANVTLGIPRLREIVMTASQHIKTPTMQLPILDTVTDEELKTFCQSSSRLTLSQVIDEVTVKEHLSSKSAQNHYSRQKLYTIRLAFYPREDYTSEYSIDAEKILRGIHNTFVPTLDNIIRRERRQMEKQVAMQSGDVGAPKTVTEFAAARARAADEAAEAEDVGVERDAGEEEDGDADDVRRAKQRDDGDNADLDEDEDEEGDDEAGLEAAFADSGESEAGSDDENAEFDPVKAAKASRAETLARMKALEHAIPRASSYVTKARFDREGGEWCELDLEVRSVFQPEPILTVSTSLPRRTTSSSSSAL